MTIGKELRQAMRSIGRSRLRTLLMMLGVMIGIASITVLMSFGESARQETMRRFKNMVGTFDTVIVRPGGGRSRGMPTLTTVPPVLTFEDAAAIESEVDGVLRVARVQNAFDVDVTFRDRVATPSVFGVSDNWLQVRDDEVAEGSFVTAEDNASTARVAVIGVDVKTALFPDTDPLGQTIRIAEVPFQVKGILTARGAGPGGGSLDNVIMIPVTTASRRLFNRNYLTMVIAQLEDPLEGDTIAGRITGLLRERHKIVPPALDDFTITNPRASMAQVTHVGSTLGKTLMGVAVLAMAIGGIVITALMLIAVTERRREIGVRRSVGASRRDILLQFLLEALVISCVGGLIGLGVGLGGTVFALAWQQLPLTLAWNAIGWAVVLSVSMGIAFGMYPAWKAAQVDPVTALRSS